MVFGGTGESEEGGKIGGRDTFSGHDDEAPVGSPDKPGKQAASVPGRGGPAGCQEAGATEGDEGFEGVEGVLGTDVEGAVEGDGKRVRRGDKPLHGELKLPGMASAFYRRQVNQHLEIGIRALERLRDMPPERLHSRKLRTFMETAFQ